MTTDIAPEKAYANEIQWIDVNELMFDPRYNRVPNMERVNKIAAEFNQEYLGTLTVSKRGESTYCVVDGQHRVLALHKIEYEGTVRCTVYFGLTVKDEARLYGGLNNFAKPTARDNFRAREVAGDEIAVDIARIVHEVGLTLTPNSPKAFAAVAAAEKIYTGKLVRSPGRHPQVFYNTLRVLTRAFGLESASVHSSLLEGMALVFFRYGDKIDDEAMVRKLSGYPGGSLGLLGEARAFHSVRGGAVSESVAEVFVGQYNKARRAGSMLPPWRI